MSREFLQQTRPATIFDIASTGSYADAYAGGEVGALSQSPTISAIGYTNNYREGGKDTWQRIGTTKASDCTYTVDLDALPKSKLYKFVVVTPSNHITRWFTHKML